MRQPERDPTHLQASLLSDRFVVGATLGAGSFGLVVQAHDRVLDREVAIKLISAPRSEGQERQSQSLLSEARLISAAGSSAVAVHDVLTSDDGIAVIMELIPRGSLLGVVRTGIPAATARRLGVAVVGSMASVHEAGVMHLDLHPGNLLIRADDAVAVGDFGLARFARRRGLSRGGHELSWTAPELLQYRVASTQADVYALGLVLGWIGRRAGVDFGPVLGRATAADRMARPRDAQELLHAIRADLISADSGADR